MYKSNLVELARDILLRISKWDMSNLSEKDKGDGSIVTNFDFELNEQINKFLVNNFPGTNIVGEEVSAPDMAKEFTWYIDPLDGTADFVKGNGQWVVQIGLCRNGIPIIGFVLHPQANELFFAEKGQGCYLIDMVSGEEGLLSLSEADSIEKCISLKSNSRPNPEENEFSTGLSDLGVSMGSFGLKVSMIARGDAHLYANFRKLIGLWDLCAPQVILEEAGGLIFFEGNESPDYQQTEGFAVERRLVCCHPKISQKVFQVFEAATN